MPFWRKNEEPQGDDLDIGAIFDDDDAFVPYVAPEKVPVVIKQSVLDALEQVRQNCERIRNGKSPSWPEFFKNFKIVEKNWNDLLETDEINLVCFPSQFFEDEDLVAVEWIYSDQEFLDGMLPFIKADVHTACWLLTSEHSSNLTESFLTKLFYSIMKSEMGDSCEECGQNLWWGSPLAYLAENENSSADLLKKIFNEAKKLDNEVALAALAINEKTPKSILGELALLDKRVHMLDDEMCPFQQEAAAHGFNIGQIARSTLATFKS